MTDGERRPSPLVGATGDSCCSWVAIFEDQDLASRVDGATGANIDAFKGRGGKLLMDHGLADSIANPVATIAFYDTLAKARAGSDLF